MKNEKIDSFVMTEVKRPAPIEPYRFGSFRVGDVVPFGVTNLFPNEVAEYLRRAKVQRGICNSKADFFAGSYFVSEDASFLEWEKNGFFKEHTRLVKDFEYSGNAYLHIITDARKSFVQIKHIDFTKCRKTKDGEVIVAPDWKVRFSGKQDKILPTFPNFYRNKEMFGDDLYHSSIHLKEYEPEFKHYGIPSWISGWENMLIDIRTDEWNLSHLDTGLKPDLVINMPSGTTEQEIAMVKENMKDFKEGKPGSALFIFGDGAKTTVVNEKVLDMDWSKLNDSNVEKTLIANSWFKSLMSVSQSTGFDTQRVKWEYQLALRQIMERQEFFVSEYKNVLDVFGMSTDFEIYNSPIIPEEPASSTMIQMMQ